MVAGQEVLDLVAAVAPPVPHDAHVGAVVGVGLVPVAEQVVDDGVEPLRGRVPRLEQVVVEPDRVDRLDRHVGVGVRREQQQLGAGSVLARALQELDPRHLRHALVGGDQRHPTVAQRELGEHLERLGTGAGADDAVVLAVARAQVARDRLRHLGVVVHGEDGRLRHGSLSSRARRPGLHVRTDLASVVAPEHGTRGVHSTRVARRVRRAGSPRGTGRTRRGTTATSR